MNQGAVILPDSPTYCSQVAARRDEEGERSEFLESLDAVMTAAKLHKFRNVILDLGPGTYGINGAIFAWIGQRYPASLILLSSPRAFDLATSLYETSWLSALGEFAWHKPVLHVVNMWNDDVDLRTALNGWVDRFVPEAINAITTPGAAKVTPASLIYAWRLWSYLYAGSLRRLESRLVRSLPEDPKVRTLANPPIRGEPFSLNTKVLERSKWYQDFQELVQETLGIE